MELLNHLFFSFSFPFVDFLNVCTFSAAAALSIFQMIKQNTFYILCQVTVFLLHVDNFGWGGCFMLFGSFTVDRKGGLFSKDVFLIEELF